MNSRTVKIAVIALVAMMTTGSFAYAQRGEGKHKGHRGDMIQKIIKKLDLTADQQTRIKAIRENFKSANAATIEQMKALRTQMEAARKSGDKAQMTSLKEQMKAKMESLRPARERMIEEIKGVLTAEQRAELEKMMQKRAEKKEKMGDRKGKKEKKGERAAGQGAARQSKKAPAID